ncbi:hypothetical protein KK141_17320 [Dyella sp. LX-66]|uniref:hypothetical protein n=1 Tax=unclassified Dyella TaxID=2634549 RepID=UPI001BE05851|nr:MULTISPECIES: hypothetical protein [unclassified Dyella]MBT2117795.1 hypothetical protein [Dyella sp. LX-1]MBT2141310.1 hypothetical protein [Dyella sp. LX-66]
MPIASHKLLTAHAIADAINSGDLGSVVAGELLDWLRGQELESEVAEVLSVLMLAGRSPFVRSSDVLAAIRKPSLLSDIYLTDIFGVTPELVSVSPRHSGPADSSSKDEFKDIDREPWLLPNYLRQRLYGLGRYMGCNLMRQWSHEFQQLGSLHEVTDGQFSYFDTWNRDHAMGHFVGRRGHLARSAYLRTLAYAAELDRVTPDVLMDSARAAGPSDSFFLRMPPDAAPSWASSIRAPISSGSEDFKGMIDQLDRVLEAAHSGRRLLQLDASLLQDEEHAVDLSLVSILIDEDAVIGEGDIEFIMEHHECYRCAGSDRDQSGDLHVRPQEVVVYVDDSGRSLILPLVAIGREGMGYMHDELMERRPYVTAVRTKNASLRARPRPGGADIELDDRAIGEISYWNVRWAPIYLRELGPSCATSLTVDAVAARSVIQQEGYRLTRVWRARIVTRTSQLGSWSPQVLYGEATLPL